MAGTVSRWPGTLQIFINPSSALITVSVPNASRGRVVVFAYLSTVLHNFASQSFRAKKSLAHSPHPHAPPSRGYLLADERPQAARTCKERRDSLTIVESDERERESEGGGETNREEERETEREDSYLERFLCVVFVLEYWCVTLHALPSFWKVSTHYRSVLFLRKLLPKTPLLLFLSNDF